MTGQSWIDPNGSGELSASRFINDTYFQLFAGVLLSTSIVQRNGPRARGYHGHTHRATRVQYISAVKSIPMSPADADLTRADLWEERFVFAPPRRKKIAVRIMKNRQRALLRIISRGETARSRRLARKRKVSTVVQLITEPRDGPRIRN